MSNQTTTIMTVIGFIFFLSGMSALSLSIVGVQLSFLSWVDSWGGLTGLLIKLSLVIVGVLLIVVAQGDFEGKNDYHFKNRQ